MGELTEEQKLTIERNRLLALERLTAKKRAATELEVADQSPKPKSIKSGAIKKGLPLDIPEKEPIFKREVSKKETKKEKLRFSLESPKTFYIYGADHLDSLFRSFPGAIYEHKEKAWKIPISHYQSLLQEIPEEATPSTKDTIPENIVKLMLEPKEQREEIGLKFLDVQIRNTLFPFQKEGIEIALQKNGRVILADDMGLGKSIQAISIASYYRSEWPLLIVTPASMVATWEEQLRKWLCASIDPEEICVTYDSKSLVNGTINVISYDMAVRLVELINKRKFKVIIADESHSFRNREAKRTKVIVPVLKKAIRAILLSGTPALSRPVELYNQVQAVNPKLFPKFFHYGMRYCAGYQDRFGWNFKGSSNLRELNVILESTIMIRRTKDQVLSQLPRKIRQQVFLKLNPKDLKEFNRMAEEVEKAINPNDPLESLMKRAEYMNLWKKTAEVKLQAMLDYIDDLLDGEAKILVFAHHLNVLDNFENYFYGKKINFIRIDGSTPTSERQELCNQFQTDIHKKIALLSITAASVGN
jgi:SWI/SNF-related matrix-associated actin-dependent regulator 1 of chromatin subfamily A